MKIIIRDGVVRYKDKIQEFVIGHRFYHQQMEIESIAGRIEQAMKKSHSLGSRGHTEKQYQNHTEVNQLGLYLKRENNKQIFTLFELIISHPQGITYQVLSRKLKTDIITISHYCCKLKKLRLIFWNHDKDGVVVFSRGGESIGVGKQVKFIERGLNNGEIGFDYGQSMVIKELGLGQNIWVNVSSEEAVGRGGLTNEEIKRKIMKHSQNKMVRRTVQGMKYLQRQAQRQGKVFQFKYRNQTQHMREQMLRRQGQTQIQLLNQSILIWLQQKFTQFQGQTFLLDLINNKFKDYISSLGVKQSKRQCTPLKLNRYIKVLNYLHRQGGMRESQLRNLIVKDQKQKDIGTMHKRSLMGILEGLKNLKIVLEDDGYYYPAWADQEDRGRRREVVVKKRDDGEEGRKRNGEGRGEGRGQGRGDGRVQGKFKKISQKKYRLQLFAALLTITFDKAIKKLYRKGFNRIIYIQRRKGLQKFTPQSNILHLLNPKPNFQLTIQYSNTLESFYKTLDQIIQQNSHKDNNTTLIDTENEIIKFLRKNPVKNHNSMRIKYGKGWRGKLQDLRKEGLIEIDEEVVKVIDTESFLI